MTSQIIVVQNTALANLQGDYIGRESEQNTGDVASLTFSSADLGSAAPSGYDKYVVAALSHIAGFTASVSVSSGTIDGETATIAVNEFETSGGVRTANALMIAGPITATSGDIVFTLAASRSGDWVCAQWYIYADSRGTFNKTPSATDSGTVGGVGLSSMTITKTAGGVLVANGNTQNGGDPTWTGATEDYAYDISTSDHCSGAHEETAAETSATITMNPTSEVIGAVVGAQWDKPT